MTDSEYILSLIDETFAEVPQIKAHHERMRLISARLEHPSNSMDARATMAMHLMQALLTSDEIQGWGAVEYSRIAAAYADALIAELNKGKTE